MIMYFEEQWRRPEPTLLFISLPGLLSSVTKDDERRDKENKCLISIDECKECLQKILIFNTTNMLRYINQNIRTISTYSLVVL